MVSAVPERRNIEFIELMEWRERIKSFETRRLRFCSWRRKGDNSREREKRRKTDLFKQTLKVMFHIITRELMSRVWPV